LLWETLIDPIRADNTSGAAELARKSAMAVLAWADRTALMPYVAWRTELEVFAMALCRAQPAMAPLFNLVNEVLLAVEAAAASGEALLRVRQTAQAFLDHIDGANQRLATATLSLLPRPAHVLTFSYSSSVLAVLLEAHARQTLAKVFCTESRPMQEGRGLAQALAGVGIAVELGVDAAITTFAHQAQIVLTGADSITAQGIVNKVGTTSLALAARHVGIPCYVIADGYKWFPAAASTPEVGQPKSGAEVWRDPPSGVRIWNAYFECTPMALISGVIGEDGLLTPENLLQLLIDMPLAQALRSSGEQ
jgi:translation initiation factor eIF-2B subunit delta